METLLLFPIFGFSFMSYRQYLQGDSKKGNLYFRLILRVLVASNGKVVENRHTLQFNLSLKSKYEQVRNFHKN